MFCFQGNIQLLSQYLVQMTPSFKYPITSRDIVKVASTTLNPQSFLIKIWTRLTHNRNLNK